MTHTPGPWHVDGKPGHEAPEIHSKERRIAKALYHRGSEDREVDANANLIAAAPDLLDALEADELFHDHIGHCDHCDTGDCKVGLELGLKARGARRDAIAKAKGRPPKEKVKDE